MRDCQDGRPQGSSNSGGSGGHTIDLAGTRTVKEILRVVNAKRLSHEICRRLSANVAQDYDSNSHAPPTTGADTSVSTAPAATAGMISDGYEVGSGSVASSTVGTPAGVPTLLRGSDGGGGDDGGGDGERAFSRGGRDVAAAVLESRGGRTGIHLPRVSAAVAGGVKSGARGKNIQSATDLLERVRNQLARSEERTRGSGLEVNNGEGVAPPG